MTESNIKAKIVTFTERAAEIANSSDPDQFAKIELASQILRERSFLLEDLSLAGSILLGLEVEKEKIEMEHGPALFQNWKEMVLRWQRQTESWHEQLKEIFLKHSFLENSLIEFFEQNSPFVERLELDSVFQIASSKGWQTELVKTSQKLISMNRDLCQSLSLYVREKVPVVAVEELRRVLQEGDFSELRQLKESFCGDFERLATNMMEVRNCLKLIRSQVASVEGFLEIVIENYSSNDSRWHNLETANNCIVARCLIVHTFRLIEKAEKDLDRKTELLAGCKAGISR